MSILTSALRGCSAIALCMAVPAFAEEDDAAAPGPIVVTATRPIADTPASSATLDAETIARTVNLANPEDALKYLPSLVVRKRHIGDTQAVLATRTSGVGASARSLIYADGVLLSALIGNNNSTASPRWGMVTPEEIARVDVLYGPFSAAYSGNSIGAVVEFTTRMPDRLEGQATLAVNVQNVAQYATRDTLLARRAAASIGDRFGPVSLFASVNHSVSDSQPLSYITAASAGTGGAPVTGGFNDVNRTGAAIRVLGAGGLEHQRQTTLKLKAALDLTPDLHLIYTAGLFVNDTAADAESYLRDAGGAPVYAGKLSIEGRSYNDPTSAFANAVYLQKQRHWSHSLTLDGAAGAFDWRLAGSLYDYATDRQGIPATALPAARSGGAGSIIRMDGTGWATFDARGRWTGEAHRLSFGLHADRTTLASVRNATADWRTGSAGTLTQAARGRTRTGALWVEDAWTPAPQVTLTVGGRMEWWKADHGFNLGTNPQNLPELSHHRFSPKAALAWAITPAWTARLSTGIAWRFPTVTELYQAVTTGNVLTVPDPRLRPEKARSAELALERRDAHGTLRLSLFHETIDDALLSQSAPLLPGSPTLFSYVQNVDRVRTKGIELAVDRRDVLPGIDVQGSLTLVDPRIVADTAFAGAVGKRPPQVPVRKATLAVTWRPVESLSLTAGLRHASRSFGTIDNSDPVAHTFQGFEGYTVMDLRAELKAGRFRLGLGVDNLANRAYYLFHPFPQRSFSADVKVGF